MSESSAVSVTNAAGASPQREYSTRLTERLGLLSRSTRVHVSLGNAKIAAVAAIVAVLWLIYDAGFSAFLMLPVAAAYLVLLVWHERTLRSLNRAAAAVAFYRRGLARIEDRWQGIGVTGDRFRDPAHPYSEDLDLFGAGSLFQLLSVARTPMGEARLANWLIAAAPAPEIRRRQSIVAELSHRVDLRERLGTVGAEFGSTTLPEQLPEWAETNDRLSGPAIHVLLVMASLAAGASLVLYLWLQVAIPMLAIVCINSVVFLTMGSPVERVLAPLSAPALASGLRLLSQFLEQLERGAFETSEMRSLVSALSLASDSTSTGRSASAAFRELARIVDWIEARHGLIAQILELPLLYSCHVAYAATAWRRRYGRHVRVWLDMIGESEALLSLAAYSYEHPSAPFPQIHEDGGDAAPVLGARELGHPLIAASACVRNSVALDHQMRLLIVSGSNMAGKSTLLRAVGINAVLAFAGGTVCAGSLRLSLFAIGTCLRRVDSLQQGHSGFHAQVLRLRTTVALAETNEPVLFLFDELLEGTNSRDRYAGATGLLRALLATRASGFVTTHDLALTELPAQLGECVGNVHFEDHFEDGRMQFDYRLRDGVVARTNALEVMRLVGLKV